MCIILEATYVFNLWNLKGTGFSRTETLMLLHMFALVGSRAIFSATSMSSGRTKPNTVYAFFHSLWFAKLMKNSGPEPTHATDPLVIRGQSSLGILLNIIPCASSVPWISAKGGPNEAYTDIQLKKVNNNYSDLIFDLLF